MSLLFSLVPLFGAICAPTLAAPQGEQLPAGLPAPSLKPYPGQLEEALDGSLDPAGLWHHMRPHEALTAQDAWDFARARRDRAEMVAELNGWSEIAAAEWLRKTAPRPVTLNYRLSQGERVLAAGQESVLPEAPVTLGSYSSASVVADYSVEIAQNSAIGDPSMRQSFTGATLGVVLLPLPEGKWWLETAVTWLEPGEEEWIQTGSSELGKKTRDHRQVLEFSGPIVLQGSAASVLQLPGGFQLQFSVTGNSALPVHEAGRVLAVDLPTMGLDPALGSLLDEAGSDVVWADAAGFLLLDAELGKEAVEWMTQEASQVQFCRLQVRRNVEGRSAEAAMVDLQLPAVQGRSYRFAHGRAFDSLVDWDVEVASSSRMADPEFRRVFVGVLGEVAASVEDQQVTSSTCLLEWSAVQSVESMSYQIAGPTQATEGRAGLPAQFVNIEKVNRSVANFRWSGAQAAARFVRSVPKALGLGEVVTLAFEATVES